jgi:hypothetical protein
MNGKEGSRSRSEGTRSYESRNDQEHERNICGVQGDVREVVAPGAQAEE